MGDGRDHAPDLRAVFLDDGVVHPLQTQGAQRLLLVLLVADARLRLGDLEAAHGLAPLPGPRPQHAGRRDVLERQATASRDLLGPDERLERSHGGVHDVDRVVRAERLRQHVVDAGTLQNGAHRAAGDDAGTGAGRLQQHDAGRLLALHRVRDGLLDPRHLEEVLLGLLDALGDRGRNLLRLAVADTDGAVAVTDDHERGEAEPPPALDHLGDAVDRHHPLEVRALLRRTVTAATAAVPAVATLAVALVTARAGSPLRSGHVRSPRSSRKRSSPDELRSSLAGARYDARSSELQSGFAGRVS